MTKKTRTILFFILLLLFLIFTPSVILYSWGYRFDIETKRITQTGGFYFKVWPKNAQIYFDGKPVKKTDFFFGALYIANLLPKKYQVEIQKEGYHPWRKMLEIKEGQVTEVKNVVLLPQNPQLVLLTKNTEEFFVFPDEKKVILKEEDATSWSLKLLELDRNIKSHLIEEKDIAKSPVSLADLKFSVDSKKVLLKIDSQGGFQFFLIDLDKSPLSLTSLDFLGKDVQDVIFQPENSQKLFIFSKETLFEADLVEKKISSEVLEDVISYQILDKNIYYLNNSGFLFRADLTFQNRQKINITPLSLTEKMNYKISIFSDKIFLQNGRNLFLFNPNLKSFETVFETSGELKLSPDFKKLLYFSDYEIWVLFLKTDAGQLQKFVREKLLIGRFSEKINNAFWYTSHYLIFNLGDKIKIAEVDDRDRINIVDLAELKTPEMFWNETNKKLYILSQGNLYSSEKLLP